MGKAGVYIGCLGFVVLIGLLTGLLSKFMPVMLALLVSGLALSSVFALWFSAAYKRLLAQNRLKIPSCFDDDQV